VFIARGDGFFKGQGWGRVLLAFSGKSVWYVLARFGPQHCISHNVFVWWERYLIVHGLFVFRRLLDDLIKLYQNCPVILASCCRLYSDARLWIIEDLPSIITAQFTLELIGYEYFTLSAACQLLALKFALLLWFISSLRKWRSCFLKLCTQI
jgi:hypothetical protein